MSGANFYCYTWRGIEVFLVLERDVNAIIIDTSGKKQSFLTFSKYCVEIRYFH